MKQKMVVVPSHKNHKELFELFDYFLKEQSSTRRISKKQYNTELDDAMKRMDSGKYLTQMEVEKFFRNDVRKIK